MNICVTGGAGMIGSSLTKALVSSGNRVVVIDNLWRGSIKNLYVENSPVIDLENDFFNIDISDCARLAEIEAIISSCDIVIHLADIVAGIGYVFNKQYEIFRINNLINTNLFKAASSCSLKKLIYVGTACSFPLELQSGLDSKLNDEDLFPANPESAYGWSKLIGQLELRYLAEIAKFDIITLMLHNVYGPNCEFEGERTQVIPSLINKVLEAKDGETIDVWGSGNQGRAFIHVDEVVDAILKTIDSSGLPDYLQIGPNYCTSIKELVTTLIKISGKNIQINYDTTKPEGDKGRYANYENAKQYLDWSPTIELSAGLKQTYEWIQKNKI